MRGEFVDVGGARLYYYAAGTRGAGEPIVLLHGNPSWAFLYRDVIPPLLESGRRVVVPDMIGFGLSEKPMREHAHTLDGHATDLTALMRQLDLRRTSQEVDERAAAALVRQMAPLLLRESDILVKAVDMGVA